MRKNAIITNLFNLNIYIFVSVVFLLFLNFNEILLAADPNDSILNMKIFGDKNKVIKNAEIGWLDLRDGVGPDEYFDIKFKNDIFQVRLPGLSTYFFNISADGYKPIVMKKIEVKKNVKNITIALQKNSSITNKDEVFGPVASGYWYPSNESQLKEMVTSYLSNADIERQASNIKAIISPHAGLSISGRTAAYSFKPLIGQDINRVIVLAPSHYALFRGLSIYKADYYKTPLGLIKIDIGVCENLLKEELINTVENAHKKEHSLENMLPFLQLTVKDFELVPILVGQLENNDYKILSNILKNYTDESTVIVVSSDFTHYGRNYGYMPFPYDKDTRENIKNLDEGAIERIINLDFTGFQQYLNKTEITICGRIPIGLLLNILSKDVEGKLVKYDTSGDLMKDFRNSVSYASILFF